MNADGVDDFLASLHRGIRRLLIVARLDVPFLLLDRALNIGGVFTQGGGVRYSRAGSRRKLRQGRFSRAAFGCRSGFCQQRAERPELTARSHRQHARQIQAPRGPRGNSL